MRKVILFMTLSSIFIFNIFATKKIIDLEGHVNTNSYNLTLYYKDKNTLIPLNNSSIINGSDDTLFNLNQDGKTNEFAISISGNENKRPIILTTIEVNPFLPLIDSNEPFRETDFVNTSVYTETNKSFNLPQGYHNNNIFYKFEIHWKGKKTLSAGHYQSKIEISYTIQ